MGRQCKWMEDVLMAPSQGILELSNPDTKKILRMYFGYNFLSILNSFLTSFCHYFSIFILYAGQFNELAISIYKSWPHAFEIVVKVDKLQETEKGKKKKKKFSQPYSLNIVKFLYTWEYCAICFSTTGHTHTFRNTEIQFWRTFRYSFKEN